jgi:hypothetical protein
MNRLRKGPARESSTEAEHQFSPASDRSP